MEPYLKGSLLKRKLFNLGCLAPVGNPVLKGDSQPVQMTLSVLVVDEESERDGRVLEVVEAVGGDGEVGVERVVPSRADDELREDGRGGAGGYEDELQVARVGHREPDGHDVGARAEEEEPDVVVEVPPADGEEAHARRRDVADERAHGATDGVELDRLAFRCTVYCKTEWR
ncbi:unnamed protein product [Urochloa humidicola]